MGALFGGSATAKIPSDFLDASTLREVPDHQEVYVGMLQEDDISVIIELLEPVEKPNLTEALVYHIDETHRVSDTKKDEIEVPVEVLTMDFHDREYVERIDIVKSKSLPTSLVFGLIRLAEYNTDVLITCILNRRSAAPVSQLDEAQTQAEIVRNIAKSFQIVDPKLFQEEQ